MTEQLSLDTGVEFFLHYYRWSSQTVKRGRRALVWHIRYQVRKRIVKEDGSVAFVNVSEPTACKATALHILEGFQRGQK